MPTHTPKTITLAAALLCFFIAACTVGSKYPATYREYAYVSNTKSNTVSVLDVLGFKKLKDIAVGVQPTGIVANPRKNEIYVVNAGSGTVSVIDAERNELATTIPVGKSPYFIDIYADGARGLVANSGDDSLSVLDLNAHKLVSTIPVGKAPGLVRAAEEAPVAVVTERDGNSISVISLRPETPIVATKSLPVCALPTDVVVMPDGSKAFVACSGSNQIAVVGITPGGTHLEVALLALLPVGKTPVQLTLKPDTGEIFVSNFDAGTISEISTGGNEVGGTYYIGSHPTRGLVSENNSMLYVSNFGSDSVAIYSVDNGKFLGTVAVGNRPDALALSANQNFLLVADSGSNDVAIVRTHVVQATKPTLFTLIPVGSQPSAIAVKSFYR